MTQRVIYSAATHGDDGIWAVVATDGQTQTVLIAGLDQGMARIIGADMTGSPVCAHLNATDLGFTTRCDRCGHVEFKDLSTWVTTWITDCGMAVPA